MSDDMNFVTDKYNSMLSQATEVDEKEKQVLTRSRMLQIAQERNIFARKLFYTLVAVIALILVLTLFIYSYKGFKGRNANNVNMSLNR